MYCPSLKEFLKLSKRANVIPVYKEISADLDTPVSSFLKIEKGEYAFLLESVEGQEKIARYSFIGIRPSLVFKSKGRNIQLINACKGGLKNFICPELSVGKEFITSSDPLEEIKKIMKGFKAANIKGLPRFHGGLVGYIGYDMVRFFEEIPDKAEDDLKLPDSIFILTTTILVFDHVNHTIKIIYNIILPKKNKAVSTVKKTNLYYQAIKEIEKIDRQLMRTINHKRRKENKGPCLKEGKVANLVSNYKKSEFCLLVDKAKKYIKKGDIIQVVLSQRFALNLEKEPFDIYRDLRRLNPSPYMFFLKLKDIVLIGASPEMLVRCEDGLLQARPIAGTRARGKGEEEDKKLERELLRSKKEKAEHIMLVDLGRNDLGRVCKTGTVETKDFMNIERYSHVMHLVTEVRGSLNRKYDIYDVLRACFPAGTVAGSPKIRAMEIIDELENLRRGAYAGCVGYFSFSHNMDTCITIRTIIVKDNFGYVQAGAGIVADSVPEKEYIESVNKAKALIEAMVK